VRRDKYEGGGRLLRDVFTIITRISCDIAGPVELGVFFVDKAVIVEQ
jgi:hypothetical protein